jgi:NADPH:quinone reductase-like Zn-dependent oxidoreductase
MRARVTATSSAHNLEVVRSLGADDVIEHRAQRFEDVVRDVDVIFDTVGGDTLARSWAVLRPTGRMVTIAASAEQTQQQRVRDASSFEPNRMQLANVASLIDAGELRLILGAAFPLSEVRRAYEHKPKHGKVFLLSSDDTSR